MWEGTSSQPSLSTGTWQIYAQCLNCKFPCCLTVWKFSAQTFVCWTISVQSARASNTMLGLRCGSVTALGWDRQCHRRWDYLTVLEVLAAECNEFFSFSQLSKWKKLIHAKLALGPIAVQCIGRALLRQSAMKFPHLIGTVRVLMHPSYSHISSTTQYLTEIQFYWNFCTEFCTWLPAELFKPH